MRSNRFLCASASLLCLLLAPSFFVQAQMRQVPASSAALPLNPLALSVAQAPQAFRASDGRRHLTFEVLALNMSNASLPVRSIAVFPADGGQALLSYTGEAIAAHLSPLAAWTQRIDRIDTSAAATIWIDLALAADQALPTALEVRVGVEGAGISASDGITRIVVDVDARSVRVIHPPLAGTNWAVLEACCDAANHHRRGQRSVDGHLVLPERFAIDFVQLDAKAEAYRGSNVNEHYFGYGKDVLAVADALVVDVYDELADVPAGAPLPPPSLPRAGGNHVILDLGDGVWAMYGHLKARSVRVKAGDRVRAGQVLAQLGNNGNSDLPHLHFQLMDSRNFALAQGVPFVFDRFELVGHTDVQASRILALDRAERRERELPLTLSIVDFAPTAKGKARELAR
ncbi:Lysostaphin [uncultured bacterium]|nr:Lysostaphin [uncultured bacterium]